jgi:rhamnose transport system permease protein
MMHSLSKHRRELSVAAVYLAMLLLLALIGPYFQRQFLDDCVKSVPLLILGIGMTFIILARQIDISIGSQFSICGVLAALAAKQGLPMPAVAVVAVLAGMLMGSINGILVGFMQLPSIVVTLATMVLLRESVRWIRQGEAVNDLPAWFQWFGASQLNGMRSLLLLGAVLLVAFSLASRYLSAARSVYAVGSDFEAARLAGLRPKKVTFSVFLLMGALTGFAALLQSVRFTSADVNAGVGKELTVIAAVVVGGTAISGGRGTLLGTFLGTLLLGTISSALIFLNSSMEKLQLQTLHWKSIRFGVHPQWEMAVQGIIILAAVSSEAFARKRGNE